MKRNKVTLVLTNKYLLMYFLKSIKIKDSSAIFDYGIKCIWDNCFMSYSCDDNHLIPLKGLLLTGYLNKFTHTILRINFVASCLTFGMHILVGSTSFIFYR